MKIRLLACGTVFMLALALVPACSKDNGGGYDKVKEETEKAVEKTGEFIEQERPGFEKAAEENIENLESQLNELRDEAAARGKEFADKHKQQMDDLEEMIRDARTRLDELKKSGEAAWPHLREGLENAYQDIDNAFSEASEEFKK